MFKKYYKEINLKLDSILKLFKEEKERRDKWERDKENMLFENIDEKCKLLNEKILLKDSLNVKEKLNDELEKETSSQKKTIKELTSEINSLVKYKTENENLKKEVKKLEKEIEKYREKGVVIPKKVPWSTIPRKSQPLKETVRPV